MVLLKVSVLVTTLNEAANIQRCLNALKDFDEIIVIDSGSHDETVQISLDCGARVEQFVWNGKYPKKRQYCLDHIKTKHDMIFFVDGDEEVTPQLIEEIKNLNFKKAGYFVQGQYQWEGKTLHYGLRNNKLVLFDRHKFEFPVVNDLGAFCMGEIEGHYQPILKAACQGEEIGQLCYPLKHFAYEDKAGWEARHKRYAKWEAGMIAGKLYPKENKFYRESLKCIFRKIWCRGAFSFLHSYIYKRGFLDGKAGLEFALSRRDYYKMVASFRLRE